VGGGSFVDVTDRRHPLPAPADCAAFWTAVDKADEIGRKLQAGIRKTFASLIVEFKEDRAYATDISDATREQYGRCMDLIREAWGDDPVESLEASWSTLHFLARDSCRSFKTNSSLRRQKRKSYPSRSRPLKLRRPLPRPFRRQKLRLRRDSSL
jgi:hypothetical protein